MFFTLYSTVWGFTYALLITSSHCALFLCNDLNLEFVRLEKPARVRWKCTTESSHPLPSCLSPNHSPKTHEHALPEYCWRTTSTRELLRAGVTRRLVLLIYTQINNSPKCHNHISASKIAMTGCFFQSESAARLLPLTAVGGCFVLLD